MKMTSKLAAFLTTMLLAATAGAAQFYKWTDDQGVTHYSEEAPPASAGKASEVKVRTKLPSGAREAMDNQQKAGSDALKKDAANKDKSAGKKDEKPQSAANAPKDDAKTPEQYAEKCKQLKENLATLQSRGRVREAEPDGSVRALSDEEKQQRQDETQRQIKAFCEG